MITSLCIDINPCHGKHDPRDTCFRCDGMARQGVGRLHGHLEPPHDVHAHGPPYDGEEDGTVVFFTEASLADPDLPEHIADEIRENVEKTRGKCMCGQPGEGWCGRCVARITLGLPDDWPGLVVGAQADGMTWDGEEWRK